MIHQPADQPASRRRVGRLGGRPPAFGREAYKQRYPPARLDQNDGLAVLCCVAAHVHAFLVQNK
ncbi:hypothetical protein ACIQU5_22265 [Streptomyces sp. NPDC090306]|uniref:hypothetical protein n=1 Tax=Streptomyces sp. NPDC090306 TaxID=3365961 RepID=UPI00381CF9A1